MAGKSKSCIIPNVKEVTLEIPGYPVGSDITVINTSYVGRCVSEDGGYEKDFLTIIYRDNVKGVKKSHVIYEPLYTFYLLKEEYGPIDHNLLFIEKDKVIPITCKYADILKAIAEVTGNLDFYNDNKNNGNNGDNRRLHSLPNVFRSDMPVENYYRYLFGLSYPNNSFKISKAYLDIETDGRYSLSDFPEPGEVPINAIAYCDEAHNTTYQFLLNDPRNPKVEEYRQWVMSDEAAAMEELRQFVIGAVGGWKNAKKFGVYDMKYHIVFFDDELQIIDTMFKVIHKSCPDVAEIWNMSFDMNFIAARIERLGADPLDIIADPRIDPKFYKFYVDERNKNNYEDRGDYLMLSSYTVWLDQMLQFAIRRKGGAKFQSFKLDAIGELVAGVRKLDYSHITSSVTELPYLNFKTFSFYNVMDVIVQKCIEVCTQDIEYVFMKTLMNNTTFSKVHRKSTYLYNRFSKDFDTDGFIMGNNKNVWNEKPTTKFPGAMVGNPLHNSPKVMIHINGRPTMVAENAVDFDYSALYPSIALEFNIAPNTQLGRLIIEDPDNPDRTFGKKEHPDMFSNADDPAKYIRGGEFLENFMSANILEFCERWLGLGDIYEVLEDMYEFFQRNDYYGRPYGEPNIGVWISKDNMIQAVTFDSDYGAKPAVVFNNTLDDATKAELRKKIEGEALL